MEQLLHRTGLHSLNRHVNPNHYRATGNTALVLAPDPLAAALIGAAVELAGIAAAFVSPGETAKVALRRLRPMCVLLSHDEPSAFDDAFMGPAMMTGARLFVFGTERRLRLLEAFLERYRLETLALPRDLESLRDRLTGATGSSPHRPEWTGR
jgi:hypothetical protein